MSIDASVKLMNLMYKVLYIIKLHVVFQVESGINELLSAKCPASIINPPGDTTYLLRDYEVERKRGRHENGDRVQSEEAFCGHTSLHSKSGYLFLFSQYDKNNKSIRLNSNPWVSIALTCLNLSTILLHSSFYYLSSQVLFHYKFFSVMNPITFYCIYVITLDAVMYLL